MLNATTFTSIDQLLGKPTLLMVACPRLHFGARAHRDLTGLLDRRGLLSRSTQYSITLSNSSVINFVDDKPEHFRGRKDYYFSTLDNLEKILDDELSKEKKGDEEC